MANGVKTGFLSAHIFTHGQLVLLRQLIHSKNGNDILERLVVLEDLLHGGGDIVVLLSNLQKWTSTKSDGVLGVRTYHTGVQHTRAGIEGIDGRVDTKLSNTTGQHSGGIQVGKGGSRGRISQIISGHVDGLHGSDRTLLGGGDTFLPKKKISIQFQTCRFDAAYI